MELEFKILEEFEKCFDDRYYQVLKLNNKKYFLDLPINLDKNLVCWIERKCFYLEDFLSIFYKINKKNKIKIGKTILIDISEEISKYIIFLEKNNNGDIDFSIKTIFKNNKEPFKFEGYFIDKYKEEFLLLQREKEEAEKEEAISQKREIIKKRLISLYKKYNINEIEYGDFIITYSDLNDWNTYSGFSYEAESDYSYFDTYTKYCPLYILNSLIDDIMKHGTNEFEYLESACIYFN